MLDLGKGMIKRCIIEMSCDEVSVILNGQNKAVRWAHYKHDVLLVTSLAITTWDKCLIYVLMISAVLQIPPVLLNILCHTNVDQNW